MGVRPSAGPKIVLAAVGRELVPPPARFAIRCGADSPPTPLHRIRFSLHRNAFWCIETRFGAPKRVLALRNAFWRSETCFGAPTLLRSADGLRCACPRLSPQSGGQATDPEILIACLSPSCPGPPPAYPASASASGAPG